MISRVLCKFFNATNSNTYYIKKDLKLIYKVYYTYNVYNIDRQN